MRLFRMTVRTALRALARNLTRSGLTALGVVIGVAALVTVTAVSAGAQSRETAASYTEATTRA